MHFYIHIHIFVTWNDLCLQNTSILLTKYTCDFIKCGSSNKIAPYERHGISNHWHIDTLLNSIFELAKYHLIMLLISPYPLLLLHFKVISHDVDYVNWYFHILFYFILFYLFIYFILFYLFIYLFFFFFWGGGGGGISVSEWCWCTHIWGSVCQKHVSSAGTSNHIPYYM